ncbi:aminotransferase class IV [Actinotalea ferrariae]|uniref:aminotransferase class IV n=1 Tax=Actinotalea ferrariae TaxID=1386098 RepID=UPI001C8C89D4|nr:aminotransferase class IV [Actinotalea ferrariae]MBX9246052.1 aminotransferase class IV [Actinotalea ferrariae]
MSDLAVWADGRLRDAAEPVLSAVDHGVTVGDGVFETCGVVRGSAFALTRHLARLVRSARGLGLEEPDLDAVRTGVDAVLAERPGAGRVRITVTAGLGPLGSGRTPGAQTVLVVAGPAAPPAPVRLARVPWTRNEGSAVAGLKTTSYAENVVALGAATRQGADEAVLANTRGALCEGTGSNVFVERGGELLTPELGSGCLAGITRELVLEWSAEAGLPVREASAEELPYAALDGALTGDAHLAISGSVRTFVPVVALDGQAVPVGPLTERVAALYREREALDVDP